MLKKKGEFKGRKATEIPKSEKYYFKYEDRDLNKMQLTEKLNISRPTLDKLIKQKEKNK